MPYFLIVPRLFYHPCIREKEHKLTKKWPEMTVMGHVSIGLLQARFLIDWKNYELYVI